MALSLYQLEQANNFPDKLSATFEFIAGTAGTFGGPIGAGYSVGYAIGKYWVYPTFFKHR